MAKGTCHMAAGKLYPIGYNVSEERSRRKPTSNCLDFFAAVGAASYIYWESAALRLCEWSVITLLQRPAERWLLVTRKQSMPDDVISSLMTGMVAQPIIVIEL